MFSVGIEHKIGPQLGKFIPKSATILLSMTVRYVLSWEEFMKVHARSLPKPPIGSFICAVLISLAVGTFGELLIYFIEPQDRM